MTNFEAFYAIDVAFSGCLRKESTTSMSVLRLAYKKFSPSSSFSCQYSTHFASNRIGTQPNVPISQNLCHEDEFPSISSR